MSASTIESDGSAARRAVFMLDALAVLEGPDTINSIAVGRSAGPSVAGMGGKINASAVRDAVLKSSSLTSPWEYLPWEVKDL